MGDDTVGEQRFFDDTPLSEMCTDPREARRTGILAPGGHIWFDFSGRPCCARCLKVRSREGNRACAGVMPKLGLRGG